ncbi:hypothetical protein AALP_AA8G133900 [Arabis alpina]|uniref:MADS-box domain-containing protein n=1 Tax=Arabis alpina TaxID=50452 RepID=A0A087G6T4_ARAAL|nr:hypothetical protein AALP_AA8G133900 [Arabis alpina]
MVGMKRKIAMEKIENKNSRIVAFSKRRLGLYGKASDLCLLSGAKIAILATPVSSTPNASFYSFGHSSVDSVVSAFLSNQRPRDDNIAAGKELGFWWEDEKLAKSENPKELSDAMDSISSLLQNLKSFMENRREYEDGLKKKDIVLHETHQALEQNKALNLQSCSASTCIHDDLPEKFEGFIKKNEKENQIVVVSDNNNMNKDVVLHETHHQELDQNQTLSWSASIGIQDDLLVNLEGIDKSSEEKDHIVAISDNNNGLLGDLDGCNKELGLDEISDFETKNSEDISINYVSRKQNPCSDSDEVVEDGALVIHKDFNEDNLHLSDLDENQTVASSDNNSNKVLPENLNGYNQELDLDEFFDSVMNCEDFSLDDVWTNQNMCFGDSEAVEDGEAMVMHKDFDEDNLHFSDYFSMS